MLNILVVDDEPSLLEAVSNMLAAGGFSVSTCSNGDDAVRRSRERRFDVVLSDVIMEGLVGTALLNAIRAIPEYGDVPVVFMSNMPERRVRGLIDGDYAVLRKPFQLEDLMRVVESATNKINSAMPSHRIYNVPPQQHSRWQ